MEIIFLLGRVLFGGFFIMNGVNHFKMKESLIAYANSKNVQYSNIMVPLTGVLLTFSGLGIVVGAFMQVAFGLLAIFLFATSFMMHDFWKITDNPERKMTEMQNFMKNIALAGACLMLLLLEGPWPLGIF